MQVKLLRVAQEKTARPVGESREGTIDIRIFSATHKNVAERVAQAPPAATRNRLPRAAQSTLTFSIELVKFCIENKISTKTCRIL